MVLLLISRGAPQGASGVSGRIQEGFSGGILHGLNWDSGGIHGGIKADPRRTDSTGFNEDSKMIREKEQSDLLSKSFDLSWSPGGRGTKRHHTGLARVLSGDTHRTSWEAPRVPPLCAHPDVSQVVPWAINPPGYNIVQTLHP